ncbi:MAG: PIN domain-containing protein, partial [Actinobacteria bacterium]|nr:PIN domain-containing protein [Actinomycetota bacterium]
MAFVALLDANVLYPAYLRDALLRLAEAEIYQVRWSRQILDEMARNVLENNPDLPEEKIESLVRTMERAFPEAMVTEHEPLIPSMTNDPKDRHVMAAAVRGRADVIVTSNVRDFPPEACEPYDVN